MADRGILSFYFHEKQSHQCAAAGVAGLDLAAGWDANPVPRHLTWSAERAEQPAAHPAGLLTLETLGELPAVVEGWAK